jgi:RHS repeat-associated protein
MEPLLPIRRRASQHPRRANRSPRGTRPSCTLTARPCAASQKAATTPLTNHKKNPQPRFNRNQQYSITAVSDGGGSVVERYAYTAYGQVTIADGSGSQISNSEISNRYTYTGREWDEGMSLYHYRARMYDAVSGRFASRDPIGFSGGYNLYLLYASLDRLDPTGNQPENVQPAKCSRTDCRVTADLRPNFAWDENERKLRGPWEFQIQTEGNCPSSFSAESLSRIFQNWGGSKNQIWNELKKSECNRIGKTQNDKACGPCHFCKIDNLTSYTTRAHQVNF